LLADCEKKGKRYGENENIIEKRNGSISKLRKTLYWILGRTTPVTLQLFTDTIEKIIKIYFKNKEMIGTSERLVLFSVFYKFCYT